MKCFEKVTQEERERLFTQFYNMKTKDEQDLFLQCQIETKPTARKRKRKENGKNRDKSFEYWIFISGVRKKVCLGAFASIYSVSRDRLKRIKNLLVNNETPRDKRGRNVKGNAMKEEDREAVREHIASFPVKESHYSGKQYNYLNSKLNVKIMYHLFKTKFPNSPVKYSYYIKFFKENFQLHFGRPQVDTCVTCEEFSLKIKSKSLGDEAKRVAAAEKMVHERRARKFYNTLKSTKEECLEREDLAAFAFDYMQNLQLPEIPVQDLFYLSQLSVSVFCVTDLKTDKSFFFIYHEGVAAKSPNEVCTFILDYIQNQISPEVSELRVFCDNCPGQNKNHCLVRFCMSLVETGRFKKIQQFFPVRGHSFLPCDRVFGVIKRLLKRYDRVYSVHEYTK